MVEDLRLYMSMNQLIAPFLYPALQLTFYCILIVYAKLFIFTLFFL